jgi:hypothetical protein
VLNSEGRKFEIFYWEIFWKIKYLEKISHVIKMDLIHKKTSPFIRKIIPEKTASEMF